MLEVLRTVAAAGGWLCLILLEVLAITALIFVVIRLGSKKQ